MTLEPAAEAARVHPAARGRGVHEPAVSEEDAVVAEVVEEHQVTGTQVGAPDAASGMPLVVGDAGQFDPQSAVDVLDEARAINPWLGVAPPQT